MRLRLGDCLYAHTGELQNKCFAEFILLSSFHSPFNLESTIVIITTLSIYSCVTNMTLEITSERHQTDYDLD